MKEFIIKLKLDKPNDVGFLRRSVAYIIDWYIGGVLASLPLIIIYMINNDNVTIIPQNIEISVEYYCRITIFHGCSLLLCTCTNVYL